MNFLSVSSYVVQTPKNICCSKKSDSYEKFHLKFIKEILGVHCKVSNDACRAELNRLPLRNVILQSSVKFLDHIQTQDESLVNKIYQTTKISFIFIA